MHPTTRSVPTLRWLWLALLLALWVMSGCHSYYDAGLQALKSGNAAEAEQEAREGLSEKPEDPWLNLLMAEALNAQERWAEARPYAGRAVQKLPQRPGPRVALGLALVRLNNVPAGLVQWIAAFRMKRDSMKPHLEEMRELLPKAIPQTLESDQPKEAVFMIETLRELDPQHPLATDASLRDAREAYARKLTQLVRYQEAAQLYNELATRWPDKPEYKLEEGALLLALDQPDEATAAFEAWVGSATSDAERARRLSAVGERARARNALEMAEAWWKRALEADPSQRGVHLHLAAVQLQQRRPEEGYTSLRAYIDGAAKDPRAYEDAARVALENNNGAIALELLEEATADATPDFVVATMLADLYLRRQRRGDMEDALQRYLDRASDRRAATLEVVDWLDKTREFELAAFHLNKTIAAGNDSDPQLWLRLARLQSAANKPLEMEEALREFIDRSGKAPKDYLTAARLLAQRRYYDRAEAILKDARGRHPKDSGILKQLADVYHQWGYADREADVWRDWIALQPSPAAASLEIGQLYARRADVDHAIPLLKQAARDKTLAAEAWLTMGEAYQNRGMDKEMRDAFDKYIAASPDRAQALRTLLARYSDPARAEDAIRILEMLLKDSPDEVDLRFELGERYLQLGDSERAFASFKLFVTQNRSPLRAARRAARTLRNWKRYELALDLYEELLQLKNDDPEVLADVGDIYMKIARDYRRTAPSKADQMEDAARGFYRRYVATFDTAPKDPNALSRFGAELAKQNLWAIAAVAFDKAQQLKLPMSAADRYFYGETLLNLGRFEEADRELQAHLKGLNDSRTRLYLVGRAAYNAGAWDLALRYLRRVLDERVEEHINPAFEILSRVLVQSGRRDELEPVAHQYLKLNRATWPARTKVAATYAEAGLWRQAAAEYRDMLRIQPDNTSVTRLLAEVIYQSGDRDRAIELFSGAADASSDPGTTWQVIGTFYLEHGEVELALDALKRAEAAGGGGERVQLYRGILAALTGSWDQADQDFQAAVNAIGRPDARYLTIVEALSRTPRQELAMSYAREGASRAKEPEELLRWLAGQELSRGDEARGLRDAEAWYKRSRDPLSYAELLRTRDHNLELIELLRSEVEVGDNVRTEVLIFGTPANTAAAIEQLGADRLPSLYRPLLERRANPADLHRDLGQLYARIADRDRAILHLAAASRATPRASDLLLGRLYFAEGNARQARGTFSRFISMHADSPPDLQRAVAGVVWAYLGEGALKEAESFVRGAMARPDRETLLAPVLAELLLLQGRRTEALDLLRSGRFQALFEGGDAGLTSATTAARLADLLEGARVLAGYGFGEEAARTLADVARVRGEEPGLLLGLVELGSRHSLQQVEAWANAYAQVAEARGLEPEAHRLRLADAWLQGGADAQARAVLMELTSSHREEIAQQALDRLISLAWARSDTKALDEALDRYHKGRPNRFQAFMNEGRSLRRVGLFAKAAERYGEALKMLPGNRTAVTALFQARYLAGDAKATLEAHARQRRAAADYAEELEMGRLVGRGPDPKLARDYWSRVLDTYPSLSDATLGRARAAYLAGDAKAGRADIDRYLQQSSGDPLAVEDALTLLAQLQRWDAVLEIAQATAPTGDAAKATKPPPRTPLSYFAIGVAHYAQGKRDVALKQLDTYTRFAPDPLTANLRVARALRAASGQSPPPRAALVDAVTYTERAIERAPDSPAPYLLRGLLRVGLGQTADATQDFDAWLARGAWDLTGGLRAIGQSLLEANKLAEAERYLLKLAQAPDPDPSAPIAAALQAYQDAGAFKAGLRFLGAHFPAVATAPHLDVNILLYTAGLHAGAGNTSRALTLYNQALARYPLDSTLMNNFAYVLAQSGSDLDRAERLARRALGSPEALDARSQGVYLDTLAWILFKKGKTKEAAQVQRQALRLTADRHSDAVTLYDHLAEILDALGQKEEANQARTLSRLHDPLRAPMPLAFE